jgi:NAD-dependent deacetylase
MTSGEIARLAELVDEAGSVVALTGAGISVPSGIPDFRSPGTGLWTTVDPMEVAHIDVFRRDPARFWSFYGERFTLLDGREPNAAHRALATLERHGHLDAVITQNIDMLHRRAGTSELIEVHGSIATCSCLRCHTRYPLAESRARAQTSSEGVPLCDCGLPLKPDVVLFGEMLPFDALMRAEELSRRADLMLCIGSSLEVHPVAGLPLLAHEHGARVAILTQSATPLDPLASVRLHGDVEEELTALLQALGIAEEEEAA